MNKKAYTPRQLPESLQDFIKFRMKESRPIEKCISTGAFYLWIYRNRVWLEKEGFIKTYSSSNGTGFYIDILTDSIGTKRTLFI